MVSSEQNLSLARKKNARALHWYTKGNLVKAEQLLLEALSADATFGAAHNNLGNVYHRQQKYYLAAREWDQAAFLMPDDPNPHLNLGIVYEDAGKYDQAILHYRTASEKLVVAGKSVILVGAKIDLFPV